MSRVLDEQSFFALNKAYAIRFPRIQRDFVQGRTKNAKAAAVRADFVRDLCGSMVGSVPVNMDFIYGEVSCSNGPAFLPLDGQQRLTTLLLLHWLLSPEPLCKELRGITYESRRAAMAFCAGLQTCVASKVIASARENASDAVKRQPWFRPVWSKDQTVRGMLVMLDALQNQLRKLPTDDKYWVRLCKMEMSKCLQTNTDGIDANDSLTDRIYLKMNARGLALTPFEIIKSQIVSIISEELPLATNWKMSAKDIKDNLDQQWLKFFYQTCGEKFDASMTRFFALQVYFISLSQAPEKSTDQPAFKEWDAKCSELVKLSVDPFAFSSFAPFRKVLFGKQDEATVADTTVPVQSSLIPLFRILSILSSAKELYIPANYNKEETSVIKSSIMNPSWFMDAIIPSWNKTDQATYYSYDFLCPSNYAQRTVVYAASAFTFTAAQPSDDEQRRFKEWMRICWNLIQNSTVTSENNSIEDAISLIRQFSPHAADIHAYLRSFQIPSQIYAKDQLVEEKKKIEWFSDPSKGVSYEHMIKAESHRLLKGRISLLLESPDTFASRYSRFVELMKQNDDEKRREESSNATPSHTLQKALCAKIETQALRKNTPLPTSNTDSSWMVIIATHQAAVRRLLDDPAEPVKMLLPLPLELWKRRMLQDGSLWERGKSNRKGLVLIDDRVYLYTNPTNMTSAIPLGTSIPELWCKLFNHPDIVYPELNDGNSISVGPDSCSQLKSILDNRSDSIKTVRMYFYPDKLLVRLFKENTSHDVIVFNPYPPVKDIEDVSVESLWKNIFSRCSPLVTQTSVTAVSAAPDTPNS